MIFITNYLINQLVIRSVVWFNKIFYEDILQLGEDGFNLVPCKENLTIHDIFNDKLSEIYRDLEQD